MPNSLIDKLNDQAQTFLEKNNFSAARSIYEQICQQDTANSDAWLMLGMIDTATGQEESAIRNLETAIIHNAENAEAYLRLGQIALKQARLIDACNYCERAINSNPDYFEAWMTLGMAHARSGSHDEAIHDFTRAVSLSRWPADIWADIARKLHAQGLCKLATEAYQCVLIHKPDDISALRILSELQIETGHLANAIHTCQSILKLDPNDAYAYSLMGTALQSMGNLVEAEKCLERSAELEPDNSVYWYKLACILQTLGGLDKALSCFRKAVDTEPGLPAAIGGLVRVYAQKGDDDKVQDLLEPLIEAGNKDPLVLPTLAFVAPRYGLTDKAIKLLEDAVCNNLLNDNVNSRLHHALGTLHESTGNFDAAFTSHQSSKELMRTNYSSDAHTRYTGRIMASFSRDFITTAPHSSNNSSLPVFIVGMPRSGTSLVEQILACHKDIYGAGELPEINSIVQSLSGRVPSGDSYPECCRELTGALLDEYAGYYLSVLRKHSSTTLRVIDKMPHNFRHLGIIELLFPNARIIHISRDPMDTCLSCYFQEFSAAHSYARDLQDLALHYKDYECLMHHWNNVLNIPIMNIQYEALVSRQEQVTRDLINFCGLEWDDHCLDFHTSDRIAMTLSSSQVREPIYTRAVGRWKKYEKYLKPLKDALDQQTTN